MAFRQEQPSDDDQAESVHEPYGPQPLASYDTIEVYDDHISFDGDDYVLDSFTRAETFVDISISGDGSGFTSSPPRIELVVAHPTYAWSHVVEGDDRLSEMRRLAARINALARGHATKSS